MPETYTLTYASNITANGCGAQVFIRPPIKSERVVNEIVIEALGLAAKEYKSVQVVPVEVSSTWRPIHTALSFTALHTQLCPDRYSGANNHANTIGETARSFVRQAMASLGLRAQV